MGLNQGRVRMYISTLYCINCKEDIPFVWNEKEETKVCPKCNNKIIISESKKKIKS